MYFCYNEDKKKFMIGFKNDQIIIYNNFFEKLQNKKVDD